MTDQTRPGSEEALDEGCLCSFLLNNTGEQTEFVNPLCPMHGAQAESRTGLA